jgi:hypothetical protein
MYKETLRAIAGIDVFPVVSLVLFVVVFSVVLYRVCRMERSQVRRFAALPLDSGGRRVVEEGGHAHEQ